MTVKRMAALFLFTALLLSASQPALAETQESGAAIEAYEPYAEAREEKRAGDELSAREDYAGAAAHYLRALGAPNDFDAAEKTGMAVYISWAGDLDTAIGVLSEVVEADPGYTRARVQLARLFSWQGRLDDALWHAEEALKDDPENWEALLVKADALRWKGLNSEALGIYERLVAERDDFEARLGQAFSLLYSGPSELARESFEKLAPVYPAQMRDYNNLKRELERVELESRPAAGAAFSYYNDTDSNHVRRYTLGAVFKLSGADAELQYVHTAAENNSGSESAESIAFSLRGALSEGLSASAGLGATFTEDGGSLSGRLSAETELSGWKLGAGVSRDVLTDTAELVDTAIRLTDYSASAFRAHGKASLNAALSFRRYSDDNSSIDFSITPKYALVTGNPGVDIGYRFRYLDFDRQAGNGYFDPSGFVSHQVLALWRYERERLYTVLEPYFGYQSFERNGAEKDEFFWGGAGVAGYRLGRAALEFRAESGTYAVGSASGFSYYTAGLKIILTL